MSRRGAVAALVAIVVLGFAAPVSAAPPSGGISSPAAEAELSDAGDVVISVAFDAPSGGEITDAALSLRSIRSDRTEDKAFNGIDQGSFSYTWASFEPGLLDYNGEYRIRAEATATDGALDTNGPETTVVTRTIFLAVPPVQPSGVSATFDSSARTVAVAWTGNPEPDLLGYVVQRSEDGGSYRNLAEVEPGQTTYTDDVNELSGDYTYRLVALREGAQDLGANPGEAYEALNSDPSTGASVTVAAPPTTTTGASSSTQPGGSATSQPGGEQPATTSTSEQPAFDQQGRVDLSGFASLLDQARARPQPRATLPDPGFSDELPYGTRPSTTAAPTTAGRPEVEIALADDEGELGGDERLRSMAFLAGGLFAFVLLMHLVWIRSEVKHAPLEAEEPGDDLDGHSSDDDPSDGDGAGTLGPSPRERSHGAGGTSHRVPPRSRGDRREGRPAVRAGR